MRYMRWSYADLQSCPDDYVGVIAAVATEEKEAADLRTLQRKRGG